VLESERVVGSAGARPSRARAVWAWLLGAVAIAYWSYLVPAHPAPIAQDPVRHLKPLVIAADSLKPLPHPAPIQWRAPGTPAPPPVGEPDGILLVYGQPVPLWSLNPTAEGPVASTTKLMTAYLASASLPWNDVVTISYNAAATGGSEMFLRPGDHFTVRDLLYGMLMRSANNAAVALSEAVSGRESAFVALMNRTARSLGLFHTHYADPDGISPGSESSAADLAKLAELDLANPGLRQIFITRETSLPENPQVVNIDGIIWQDRTALGLKTGWTTPAGTCVVFAARRPVGGHLVTLVGVLLHGTTFPPEYTDAESLLNWGFQVIRPTVARLAAENALPTGLNP
jgi:D-alanyl-D-alanine carboxypeptidase (penicillin-binding protein 5/6)